MVLQPQHRDADVLYGLALGRGTVKGRILELVPAEELLEVRLLELLFDQLLHRCARVRLRLPLQHVGVAHHVALCDAHAFDQVKDLRRRGGADAYGTRYGVRRAAGDRAAAEPR